MRHRLIDTGPLVALLNAGDRYHAWARDTLDSMEPPLLTCDAVLSEACFLVRRLKGGSSAVLTLVERGVIRPSFRLEEEAGAVGRLMKKYESVPMSLADACLVRMTELEEETVILTLDSDFRIYRRSGRKAIRLIAPE